MKSSINVTLSLELKPHEVTVLLALVQTARSADSSAGHKRTETYELVSEDLLHTISEYEQRVRKVNAAD